MKIDVSVIMPLYNAKDYVKLAVDSVLGQTLKDIEVVIVDDCSTDGSFELCQELYGRNERVQLLRQPRNMGPGAARNTGLRKACGQYIYFMDSDDEIIPDTIQKMFETAKSYNADVIHHTHCMYPLPDEEGNMPFELIDDSVMLFPNKVDRNCFTEETLLSDDLSARLEDWKNDRIHWSVWSKLIRRSFLLDNGIFFSDMMYGEDMVFCFECLFKAKTYVIIPGGGYIVRLISSSLTRGKKTASGTLRVLKSQVEGVRSMGRIFREIPFFTDHPEKAEDAVGRVLQDLELGFVRPAFQVLGEEALRSDPLISDYMQEEFGDEAPYVEFLFYELHKLYEPVVDYMAQLGDPEVWKAFAKSAREGGIKP